MTEPLDNNPGLTSYFPVIVTDLSRTDILYSCKCWFNRSLVHELNGQELPVLPDYPAAENIQNVSVVMIIIVIVESGPCSHLYGSCASGSHFSNWHQMLYI